MSDGMTPSGLLNEVRKKINELDLHERVFAKIESKVVNILFIPSENFVINNKLNKLYDSVHELGRKNGYRLDHCGYENVDGREYVVQKLRPQY